MGGAVRWHGTAQARRLPDAHVRRRRLDARWEDADLQRAHRQSHATLRHPRRGRLAAPADEWHCALSASAGVARWALDRRDAVGAYDRGEEDGHDNRTED